VTSLLELSNNIRHRGSVCEGYTEVQFWNLMLRGRINDAKSLLPQINFQPDNYKKSLNPAVLSLWAAQCNNPDEARTALQEAFPDFDWSKIHTKNFTVALNEVFREVGEKHFKDLIVSILKHISKINLNRQERSTEQENLAIDCCVAALEFMLNNNNRTFDCLTPRARTTAQKLFDQLKPYTGNSYRNDQDQGLPGCLQTLMSYLDETPDKEAAKLLVDRKPTFLPSRNSKRSFIPSSSCTPSQRDQENAFEYYHPRAPHRPH